MLKMIGDKGTKRWGRVRNKITGAKYEIFIEGVSDFYLMVHIYLELIFMRTKL